MGVGGQGHAPAALPPGKTRYPLYRRLGGPQGRSGLVRKISFTGIRSPDRPVRSESLFNVYIYLYIRYICICTYIHTRTHTHARTHIHTQTHTRTRTHVHAHTHTHTHARTRTHTHTNTRAHTNARAHTHTHTHTHTHIQSFSMFIQCHILFVATLHTSSGEGGDTFFYFSDQFDEYPTH